MNGDHPLILVFVDGVLWREGVDHDYIFRSYAPPCSVIEFVGYHLRPSSNVSIVCIGDDHAQGPSATGMWIRHDLNLEIIYADPWPEDVPKPYKAPACTPLTIDYFNNTLTWIPQLPPF